MDTELSCTPEGDLDREWTVDRILSHSGFRTDSISEIKCQWESGDTHPSMTHRSSTVTWRPPLLIITAFHSPLSFLSNVSSIPPSRPFASLLVPFHLLDPPLISSLSPPCHDNPMNPLRRQLPASLIYHYTLTRYPFDRLLSHQMAHPRWQNITNSTLTLPPASCLSDLLPANMPNVPPNITLPTHLTHPTRIFTAYWTRPPPQEIHHTIHVCARPTRHIDETKLTAAHSFACSGGRV